MRLTNIHQENGYVMLVSKLMINFYSVNSLIPDKFNKFVNDIVIQSNNKIDEKKGNKFPVLHSMAKMFRETSLVSSKIAF